MEFGFDSKISLFKAVNSISVHSIGEPPKLAFFFSETVLPYFLSHVAI